MYTESENLSRPRLDSGLEFAYKEPKECGVRV